MGKLDKRAQQVGTVGGWKGKVVDTDMRKVTQQVFLPDESPYANAYQ